MAKVNLPTIKKRIDTLSGTKKLLAAAGELTRGYVLKSWGGGKGPDDVQFNKLTDKYALYKTKKGRNNIRDLLFTGKMGKSLYVDLSKKDRAILKFGAPFIEQARGNVKYAPNMMAVGSRLIIKVTQLVRELVKKR